MPRADFVTGLLLVALGLGALVQSLRMPRFEDLGVNPYSAPGLVPGLLGVVIAGLGLLLLLRAIRDGGWRLDLVRRRPGDLLRREAPRRTLLALLLTLGYALGLVGWLPFGVATGVFVAGFVAVFEWRPGLARGQVLRTGVAAVALGVATGVIVPIVFEDLFLIRLP
jgi:hypothetical protein